MRFGASVYLAAACLLGACTSGAQSDKDVIAVTVPQIAPMVTELAGPGYEVVTVASAGADPESFEPTQAIMRQLGQARVLFATGTLPFEATLTPALAPGSSQVDLSQNVELMYGTHADATAPDPHIWASTSNMARMSTAVEQWLVQACPDSAAAYRSRAEQYRSRCQQSWQRADSILESQGRPAFGAWHPSLSYFARDHGLRQVTVGAEHREMSPRAMRAAIDSLRSAGVGVLFYDHPGQSGPQGVAAEAGARAVLLEAAPSDYITYTETLAQTIAHGQPNGTSRP